MVSRMESFDESLSMCGEFVTNNTRKTSDPVEFVQLIRATEHCHLLAPMIDDFDAAKERKEAAKTMLKSVFNALDV